MALKTWTLDDGSVVTARQVLIKMDGEIKMGAVRKRLACTSVPAKIYAPRGTFNDLNSKLKAKKPPSDTAKKEKKKTTHNRAEAALTKIVKETREFYTNYDMLKLSLTYKT